MNDERVKSFFQVMRDHGEPITTNTSVPHIVYGELKKYSDGDCFKFRLGENTYYCITRARNYFNEFVFLYADDDVSGYPWMDGFVEW